MVKIHLQKLEKGIIFQILEQEGFERKAIHRCRFGKINITISSNSHPEIRIKDQNGGNISNDLSFDEYFNRISNIIIMLRGITKNRDHDIITIPFKNNKVRDYLFDVLVKSFKRLNK